MLLRLARVSLASLALLCAATPAFAQVYATISLGANHTSPADVTVNVPGGGLAATFQNVQFSARSFDSPQYYVWRLGKLFGPSARWGVEFQFTHLKVIADTSKAYTTTGMVNGTTLAAPTVMAMDTVVQEYQMTHGLNFLTVNAVGRLPVRQSQRVSLVGRIGAGTTLPHAETNVLNSFTQHYEFAGLGVEGSAGVAVKITRLISLAADYKLSHASPRITVVGGTGQTTAVSQQIAFGLAFGFAR